MNAVFVTQSLSLRFHHQLAKALGPVLPIERRGFYVAESEFHRSFRAEEPTFGSEPHVVAEWEILREARTATADPGFLREREAAYDAGPLWDALVCDRRMMQGRWCKERQDYRPRFTHDEFLRILTVAIRRLEAWFDAVEPSILFSLVPVSFGEYLAWMIARSRGVPSLFIYPTKIQNYICWMDSFFGQPPVLTDAYQSFLDTDSRDEWMLKAGAYVRSVGGVDVRHEGMVAIPGTLKRARRSVAAAAGGALRVLGGEWRYRSGPGGHDNHLNPPVASLVRQRIVLPWRRRAINEALSARYVRREELDRLSYAFYPLHAEPEVALLIQGRAYQNQIETMRNIARSLPAGMVLLTKEHPRSIGYRSRGYYEKLLEIPNVRIADPLIESRHVVAGAEFVATVWSFVGFEAILQRKPVLSFGTPPFAMLPQTMIRHVVGMTSLHHEIRQLLATYAFDERALMAYVAACMKSSFPLDFYARYLEKRGRFMAPADDARREGGFDGFIDYTVRRVRDVCERSC